MSCSFFRKRENDNFKILAFFKSSSGRIKKIFFLCLSFERLIFFIVYIIYKDDNGVIDCRLYKGSSFNCSPVFLCFPPFQFGE